MASVDLSGQLIQYHETRQQVHKHWKTLFFHCIDISATNAHLLYKENLPVAQQSRYDHKRFVAELVKSLSKVAYTLASGHHSSSNAHRSPGRPPNSPGRPPNSSEDLYIDLAS